ncbi:MAG: VOC family protein, partial [Candidatus Promineofilum sp.]|nr:VOC family protein [Promineifilum sp.]
MGQMSGFAERVTGRTARPIMGSSIHSGGAFATARGTMRKLQTQGVHHITLIGADRQTSIDFWEGVLGMPFIFEQPNL